ncbi:PKD domain-containing protein [Polaribacter sp. MSW13]|uniref:PKD domain-containing protein n=1 Tax=Polaribacter marinus TaxID=2916838 RepID=A0A9X1VMV3_9FLAO|nr:PKD domain-containing protein [Polaribacter marinus]MCI2228232.1 PKD domain-containing protein [Polaribacter marinus]
MKQITNKIESNISKLGILLLLISSGFIFSCEDNNLPETGSIADVTPPQAGFSATVSNGDWKTYDFSNQSVSATDYVWDFGDGVPSTDKEPSHTFIGEGTYTVSLVASDKLGASSTFSTTVEVIEPAVPVVLVPDILEAGFEDGMLAGGTGDGRDSWRISGGSVFGITSSPVRTGSQGAKFSTDGRVAYQALEVSPNTDYEITIFYTMKTSPVGGEMRLAVLGKHISNASEAEAEIFAFVNGTDQSSSSTYVELKLAFNSGNRTEIAIWMDTNQVAEARVDDVSIAAN